MLPHPMQIESTIELAQTEWMDAMEARKVAGWTDQEVCPLSALRSFTTREVFEQLKELQEALPTKDDILRWQACKSEWQALRRLFWMPPTMQRIR